MSGEPSAAVRAPRLAAPGDAGIEALSVRPGRLALVGCVGLLIWALPRPEIVDPRAWRLLAIFVATILGIIVKPLPMGAVAVVGLATALVTNTLTTAQALSGFSNGTVWLVVAAFLLAGGFIKTGLGARIAYRLVTLFGRSTLGLGYSLVATDFVLAPAIPSNTARAGGVVFPILQALSKSSFGDDPVRRRRTSAFLTLVAYNGTVVTGAMFFTGMVANPLAVELAAGLGVEITWRMWGLAAVVPGAVSLIVVPWVIYRLCPPGAVKTPDAPAAARVALAGLGPPQRRELLMGTISVTLIVVWILGPITGLDVTAAALLAVAALLLTGVLEWEDVTGAHEAWNTFVWFAAVVTMATYLAEFGLTGWFADQVGVVFAGTGWIPGFVGLSLVYFYAHYFFASNTTHVSALYAPFLALAIGLGAPPLLSALALAFFSNLFASLTHYGTAPAPILFGSGYVALGTWWRVGAVLSVVNIVIWLGIGGAWWRLLGLW